MIIPTYSGLVCFFYCFSDCAYTNFPVIQTTEYANLSTALFIQLYPWLFFIQFFFFSIKNLQTCSCWILNCNTSDWVCCCRNLSEIPIYIWKPKCRVPIESTFWSRNPKKIIKNQNFQQFYIIWKIFALFGARYLRTFGVSKKFIGEIALGSLNLITIIIDYNLHSSAIIAIMAHCAEDP